MSVLEEEMWYINRQVPQGAVESIAAYKSSSANVDKRMKQATRDFKETERMLARARATRQDAMKVGLHSEIDVLEAEYEADASRTSLLLDDKQHDKVGTSVNSSLPSPQELAVIRDPPSGDAPAESASDGIKHQAELKPAFGSTTQKAITETSRVRGGIARRKLRAKERGAAPPTPSDLP
jgi:hypothetical protein